MTGNFEWIKRNELKGLKITDEELGDQMQRLSASNHKNNFPHIMLLIEDRSLNYSLSIVYGETISSSLFSIHLSFSPDSIRLVLILSPAICSTTQFTGSKTISNIKLKLQQLHSLIFINLTFCYCWNDHYFLIAIQKTDNLVPATASDTVCKKKTNQSVWWSVNHFL